MTASKEEIFDFWARIGPDDHVHPADHDVFERLASDGHKFDHRSLPGCFMGPLRTASVVLLFMSPGFSEEDATFAGSKEGRDFNARNRTGHEPLPPTSVPGGTWWRQRTACFGVADYTLSKNVAVLNIGAYHSKEMLDPELLAALPSSRVCLDWAQSRLFPEAERGERVVICLRAAKFWGLRPGKIYGKSLYAPLVNRGGHMLRGDGRDAVVSTVRSRLLGASG
jgi:hypothetical protein